MTTDSKPCEVCGSPFHRKRSESPSRWSQRRYCGNACQIASMRGVSIAARSKPFRQIRSNAMPQAYYEEGYGAPVSVAFVNILAGDPYWSSRMKRVEG